MAVPGLNANQLVTQTAAGTAGFVLKSGQSNVTLKCMTRAEAGARYHLMQTGTLVSVDTLQIDYHHMNYGLQDQLLGEE
jgi:hypothetical protein